MLHLYQSNQLEALAQMLAALHQHQPLSSPFAAEQIVVQSQGMRRYVNQFLAKEQGIAANIQFSLPAGLSFRLMRETMPDTPELNPFDTEVMRWRLLSLFRSATFEQAEFQAARDVLNRYLCHGEYAAYQLAGQLADVFDQYLVYRPHWIETWHAGKLVEGISDEQHWQAILWRYLDDGRQSAPHRVQLWQNLMQHLNAPPAWLPERFLVFGIATLAPMYLALLVQLAKTRDVHIFALNPSENYWGQIIEPAQILAQNGEPDLGLQGHPLLASLGKQGRDFFDALNETEVYTHLDVYDPPPVSGSLLRELQANLQTQTLPQHGQYCQNHALTPETALPHLQQNDRSIQIHNAHSPLRELQILKDHILQALHDNPDWQAHDIAILTPRIEPYAPYIHAVFGQQTGAGQALPYSLSDVKRSRRQPLLYALEQTLALLNSRFEVEQLLALLDNDLVLQKFALSREDLPLIHDTVAKLNIHWGADQQQRAQFGDKHSLFTWQQGLERLILGWMLPENRTLWQGISAWHTRPEHLPVLSRFSALVRQLAQLQREWQTPTHLAAWTARVRQLLATLFAPSSEDSEAVQLLEQSLANWLAESELAGFEQELSALTIITHLQGFLHQSDEAGFLRGGITFCGMVPMRSLPFKFIGLIGLNDGDFPRHVQAASFDLIAKHPQKGDRARRDDDRYLFLEAILSAREVLYLSFVGQDMRTNEARTPSTLLNELVDCVAEMTGVKAANLWDNWVQTHPLQAFSRQYFSGSLLSTRQDYADALNAPALPVGDFFRQPENGENEVAPQNQIIEQKDFIAFWRNPVRRYLNDTLQWQSPHQGAEWDASEPFDAKHTRQIADAYIAARRQGRSFEDLAVELGARSLLPAGELGEWVKRDFAAQAAALDGEIVLSTALPERSGVFDSVSGSLNYRVSHHHTVGQIIDATQLLGEHNEHGRLSSADKIALLLHHLIFCATTPDDEAQPESRQTHLVQLPQILTLPPIAHHHAQTLLANWISVYQQGKRAPLPFFPRVQLQAAAQLFKPQKGQEGLNHAAARKKAAEIYHKGYQGMPQADYPEVKLVFGRNPDAEPPYLSDLFMNLTENLFDGLSGCLQVLVAKSSDKSSANHV